MFPIRGAVRAQRKITMLRRADETRIQEEYEQDRAMTVYINMQ